MSWCNVLPLLVNIISKPERPKLDRITCMYTVLMNSPLSECCLPKFDSLWQILFQNPQCSDKKNAPLGNCSPKWIMPLHSNKIRYISWKLILCRKLHAYHWFHVLGHFSNVISYLTIWLLLLIWSHSRYLCVIGNYHGCKIIVLNYHEQYSLYYSNTFSI